ncbi:hypothetical protein CK501_14480 [Halovibrio salipaludis]|uniref:Uncharacterized protein n=1 Tax=Halovibrio salipaludis TaxID=2032626 RepID=A0A2A2F003_9GAMM|nr:hypothetical protein [Halovibrio salipaludis]PAU77893.1 hypothetical protein CK501_14480 [Halovibrio salipaludis]
MTDLYLGYPVFIWQALLNLSSLGLAGLLVAFVTTFYLKRKDESIRVAGVILEKRVNAQHEILRYLEDSSQKLEMPQPAASAMKEIMEDHGLALPYDPHLQYADIFSSVEKYRGFFKDFEELFAKHKLWLDLKVRHQMLLIQAYFSAINASLLTFDRLPLPAGMVLAPEEKEDLSNQLLFILGIALDEEFNQLLMDLEVLMVNSIYKLDLSRPKKSFLAQRRENREAKKVERFLLKKSLMGQYLPKIAMLAISLLEAKKGEGITSQEAEEYFRWYSDES